MGACGGAFEGLGWQGSMATRQVRAELRSGTCRVVEWRVGKGRKAAAWPMLANRGKWCIVSLARRAGRERWPLCSTATTRYHESRLARRVRVVEVRGQASGTSIALALSEWAVARDATEFLAALPALKRRHGVAVPNPCRWHPLRRSSRRLGGGSAHSCSTACESSFPENR